MKKFYTLMAMATALTASAAVLPSNGTKVAATSEKHLADLAEYAKIENVNNGMFKAPAVGDVNNYYSFTYVGRTRQDNSRQFCTVQVKKTSATEVMIYGLFNPIGDFGVKGTYNAAEQSITIAPQEVLPAERWDGSNAMNLYCIEFEVEDRPDGSYIVGEHNVPGITFYYQPNGVEFTDGTTGYEGAWLPESNYYQLMFNTQANVDAATDEGMSGWVGSWKYGLALPALEELYPMAPAFTFDENEWTKIGNSKLTDGWYKALNGTGYPAYDVETYVNKADANLYLLRNPYGANSPYAEVNKTPDAEGYIILNVENPECVLVRPNVNAGFVNEEITGIQCNATATTTEGYSYYIDESEFEDIIAEAEMYGDPLPTMDANRVITLPNCRMQVCPAFDSLDQWINANEEPIPMESQIVLAAAAGVEGVISDAENAPKRFFNLQGMEVVNPAAGELVIVKQGNKTSKVIVK